MRKFWTLFLCLSSILVVSQAQPTDMLATEEVTEEGVEVVDGWTKGGTGTLTFNQIGLKNWSAGGDPSISFLALATYQAQLRKGKHLWKGQVWGEYGLQKIKGESFRKNSDRIELFTKYGYKVSDKWYIATLLNAKSQFTNTYNFDADGQKDGKFISRFASPLVIEYSLGMDFVPNDIFSLYLSPLAAKFTIVRDGHIKPTYGVALNETARKELGAMAIANYNHQVHENVQLSSVLKLYKDYLDGPAQNIDVDWQTTIGLKVTKFITANIFTHLIWDYNSDTVTDDTREVSDPEFDASTIGTQRAVQFKDVIGVGFTFNF